MIDFEIDLGDPLTQRRIAAFHRLVRCLWCPYDTRQERGYPMGHWRETGRPFLWSPHRPAPARRERKTIDGRLLPARDFDNPYMEWRHPSLALFLAVWDELDRLRDYPPEKDL